ncbi:translation initiation factor IF-2 [Marinobacter nanhaiticus D15-8W]|uniref:Initiation factor 2B n=1 Tax=Marinobacter nanhaiticus D15-8W TaxID=626887 RepID=N6W4U8_9GAMM|nr:translation initiation factor IF-2 [Marinobacter nanhaiticus]ENO15179.1 initiation factor 2B [Marinobacter nanhaiticus D15-8W]BES69119.1 translation initiation factor IF-2 [Marinobacter nanhaiticus D15-8W]
MEREPDFITRLREDQTSGASQLALQALDDGARYLESTEYQTFDTLTDLAETLKAARPSMVPLRNAVERWQQALDRNESAEALQRQAIEHLRALHRALNEAGANTAQNAVSLIEPGATIMTHSRSSTVMRLFQELVDREITFQVIVTLSGPGNEGLQVARDLAALRVPTTLITDAQIGLFMAETDINISGCDCWLSDGYFINKSGTYLQALAARDWNKPFWVLADSFRDSPALWADIRLEEKDPAELGCTNEQRVRARNIYFETVAERLITGRVDEHSRRPQEP